LPNLGALTSRSVSECVNRHTVARNGGANVISRLVFLLGVYQFRKIKYLRCSVGIKTGNWLDSQGIRVRFPVGAREFSLHGSVQTGSGAHQLPISGYWEFFPQG
jgi:hypothetical protein